MKKLDHLLGYLKATIDKVRIIDNTPFDRLHIFVDSAFSAHPDGKGQTGCCVFLGNTATDIITRKQRCSTRDSTESELVGLADMLLEVEYHKEWLKSQGYELKTPIIFQDNTSTLTLVEEGGGKFRNKHLRALRGVVEEAIDEGDIQVQYISTNDMVADLLTKHLYKEISFIVL